MPTYIGQKEGGLLVRDSKIETAAPAMLIRDKFFRDTAAKNHIPFLIALEGLRLRRAVDNLDDFIRAASRARFFHACFSPPTAIVRKNEVLVKYKVELGRGEDFISLFWLFFF